MADETGGRGPLRPFERRVRQLMSEGVPTAEIARRFRRGPGTIERVRDMSELRRGDGSSTAQSDVLNPLERRILRWRASGASHKDIATMFRRSPAFVRRVERLAMMKLGQD
jgi:DNA-binding CsgD family transcriptional regulator